MRGRRQIDALDRQLTSARAEVDTVRRDRALLLDAFDALPVGVHVYDETGAATVINERARKGTGDRRADALVARAVDDAKLQATLGRDVNNLLELHQPSRQAIAVSARKTAHGTIVTIEDVSERVLVDAVRRDFVANVSHELRTPVGALSVLAETLLGENDLETVRRLGERMVAEADRAVRLIEDLLDLSRVEAAASQPGQPVRVDRVVGNALSLVEELARVAGVVIEPVTVSPDLAVAGDERQLVSAVRNLLENAVKYSLADGHVAVSVESDATHVVIAVRDDGVGIPARDLDRIFERFYRVDRARSRHTGGTGLGLAIVRHVAQNHGGDITVQSVEGQGSTFTMRLALT